MSTWSEAEFDRNFDAYLEAKYEEYLTSSRDEEGIAHPRCNGCGKAPADFSMYVSMAKEEGLKDADTYVRREEGTFNPNNGHFWCDGCYIRVGYPLGIAS